MLDVSDQRIASAPTEILADHDAHELQVLAVRSHGVGGDDPAALAECVGDLELVELVLVGGVEAEGDEGEALAFSFAEVRVSRVISLVVTGRGYTLERRSLDGPGRRRGSRQCGLGSS